MAITTFEQLMEQARKTGPKMIAMTAPHEPEILLSAQDAEREGLLPPAHWSATATRIRNCRENNVDHRA